MWIRIRNVQIRASLVLSQQDLIVGPSYAVDNEQVFNRIVNCKTHLVSSAILTDKAGSQYWVKIAHGLNSINLIKGSWGQF